VDGVVAIEAGEELSGLISQRRRIGYPFATAQAGVLGEEELALAVVVVANLVAEIAAVVISGIVEGTIRGATPMLVAVEAVSLAGGSSVGRYSPVSFGVGGLCCGA